jgi:hypothetical protein
MAAYDTRLTVPSCNLQGSSCNSGALLEGRGRLPGMVEKNQPNTLDTCEDGNAGTYGKDESIEKIVVRSGSLNAVSGADLVEGANVTIIATLIPDSIDYAQDFADFYYASDALNPAWTYIGTKQTINGGKQDVRVEYTLPIGSNQAVRVSLRFGGTPSSCYDGENKEFYDVDDLVFRVKRKS